MVILSLLGATGVAVATPIRYTETVTATGSLGGSTFTDAVVTLTLVGDTTAVTNPFAGEYENGGTASVNVAGLSGTATFTGSMFAYVFQPGTVVGIRCTGCGVGPDVLDTANSVFSTYAMQTAIGPVVGTGSFINSGAAFPTNMGNFVLTSLQSSPSFQATVSSVPEPLTVTLVGTGVTALFFRRRNR
jgi:hypothetical protein